MNLKIKHAILAVCSLALTSATVLIPGLAADAAQMKTVKFGYPLAFVTQDLSRFNSFAFFPRYLKIDWHSGLNFSFGRFILSLVLIFLAVEIIIYVLEFLDFQIRNLISKRGDANDEKTESSNV